MNGECGDRADCPLCPGCQGRQPARAPLTRPCDRCEDGIRWTSRYGGNDPDVWRVGPCETCDGEGERAIWCDGCDGEAVEWFGGHKFCPVCLAQEKADALYVVEDV